MSFIDDASITLFIFTVMLFILIGIILLIGSVAATGYYISEPENPNLMVATFTAIILLGIILIILLKSKND